MISKILNFRKYFFRKCVRAFNRKRLSLVIGKYFYKIKWKNNPRKNPSTGIRVFSQQPWSGFKCIDEHDFFGISRIVILRSRYIAGFIPNKESSELFEFLFNFSQCIPSQGCLVTYPEVVSPEAMKLIYHLPKPIQSAIENIFKEKTFVRTGCHGDIARKNIICLPEGGYAIIDWESFYKNGSAYFDLVRSYCIWRLGIDPQMQKITLESHELLSKDLDYYGIDADTIWAVFSISQIHVDLTVYNFSLEVARDRFLYIASELDIFANYFCETSET